MLQGSTVRQGQRAELYSITLQPLAREGLPWTADKHQRNVNHTRVYHKHVTRKKFKLRGATFKLGTHT